MKKSLLLLVCLLFVSEWSQAKEKIVNTRKVQNVDFEGDTVDGKAHMPDGAYLVQKRSVDFIPLYKVREHFDENIKSSVDFLK